MPRRNVVVFDLDDTLYKEVDYLQSAFHEIASFLESRFGLSAVYDQLFRSWQQGGNAFEHVINTYHLPLPSAELLRMYRAHHPQIALDANTRRVLEQLHQSCVLGIITDGRSLTQRNKIKALGLDAFVDAQHLFISEETGFPKPAPEPFLALMKRYPDADFCYVGDNPSKDFLAPNQLGWTTVCLLDDGRNIHPQSWSLEKHYLPTEKAKSIRNVYEILCKIQNSHSR